MIFKCVVKHDGIDYPAGTDVPVGNNAISVEKAEIKVEEKTEETVIEQPKKKSTRKAK